MTRLEIIASVELSSDRLIKTAVRQIDKWMREGLTLEEILQRLKTFRLPSAESAKLRTTLEKAMNEITDLRSSVTKDLTKADILDVKAATQMSWPKFEGDMLAQLTKTVQKAIANEMGPRALTHELEKRAFAAPKALAQTSIAQFNNELTFAGAEVTGAQKFLYSGPLTATTRPFCRQHVGKVYTLDEIEAMDNGQDLPVRSTCGGWNCRHQWLVATQVE